MRSLEITSQMNKEKILEASKNVKCKHCGASFKANEATYDSDNDEYIVKGKCPRCLWDNTLYRLYLCQRKRVWLP